MLDVIVPPPLLHRCFYGDDLLWENWERAVVVFGVITNMVDPSVLLLV
jgi:hypothetical protein